MRDENPAAHRVLAIDPTTRGFAFAVFEGRANLIAWGLKHASRERDVTGVLQLAKLLAMYSPDVLIVEDTTAKGSRRRERIRHFIGLAAGFSVEQKIPVRRIARKEALDAFGPGATKRSVANALVAEFPELRSRLPKVRKIWMSEDERINIFDAAAFAITYFNQRCAEMPAADRAA